MAYQVDQIKTVVPDDIRDIQIIPGEDLVTLTTCTPYGVNSHRLLVRGHRIDMEEATAIESKIEQEPVAAAGSVWMQQYLRCLLIGLVCAIAFLAVVTCFLVVRKQRRNDK